MHDPLVSIALCTYNGERFLRQQLDSLVNQTYKNIEIIAVDDKSTDHTYSILEEYRKRFKFIKVFQNETNLGFRKNFESALSKTSGEYIALCDQDDLWRDDKIAIQVNQMANNILVYHDSAFIDERGQLLKKNMSDVMNFYKGNQCHYFLFENCVSGHSTLFRRSLLSSLLPLPLNIYHDKWLGFVAASKGNIDFSLEPLVNYRQHESSNTDILRKKNTKKEDGLSKFFAVTEEIKTFANFLPDDPFITKLCALLNKRLQQFISLKLFLFIFHHRHTLYYVRKKPAISKFGYCLKYLWGYRLKKALATF